MNVNSKLWILLLFLYGGSIFVASDSQANAHPTNEKTVNVTVSGTVYDAESGDPLVGVNITVEGRVIGTSTNNDGEFTLTVNEDPPITLNISIIGYVTRQIEITEENVTDLRIEISEQTIMGSDIVVSASRVEERVIDAPISIEKIDAIGIQQAAAPTFYDAIANLKGVDFSTQSLTLSL